VGAESVGIALRDKRTFRDKVINRWVNSGFNMTLERANAPVCLARGPGFSWHAARVLQYLRNELGDEVTWNIIWSPPELTRNGKLLIIRNGWLKAVPANP
jgi:hypothetical protein